MKITITNLKTSETIAIDRSVATTHPAWVHEQLGTASESELQRCLDGLNVSDFYRSGRHLGADSTGISMEHEGVSATITERGNGLPDAESEE